MDINFDKDGKYFAQISSDGKLKIWNTVSNSFEQEYTPDFHLTTPCTCFQFLHRDLSNNHRGSPSPKKKKRQEEPNLSPNIALGTTSGLLLVYSISKAALEYTIDSKTNLQINCLSTTNDNLIYSGATSSIFEWDLKKKCLRSQWKGGNEIISSIFSIPNSKNIITASKIIKVWDVQKREVIKTFTGHSSDIIFMQYVKPSTTDAYLLTGSKSDRLLSCWNLNNEKDKNAVCNYLMEDVLTHLTVHTTDSETSIAATIKSGVVHIYTQQLNGKCQKPLKPRVTIQVVSDQVPKNDLVKPTRIYGSTFRDEKTLSIGYGLDHLLTFENVTVSFNQKLQCLLRKDLNLSKKQVKEQMSKTITPEDEDAHYLTPHTSSSIPAKRKGDIQTEIPMEQRLENLTLTTPDGSSKIPKVDNVAQLLLQGLHSKDKNLLRTALCKKDENIIRNTVKRLPVTVFEPTVKELTSLLQGKTVMSHFGALWLKHFAQTHAGILVSNSNTAEMFSGAMGNINSRLNLQTPLNKLRGKLELLVPQVSTSKNVESTQDEALLLFNDKDLNDSTSEEEDMQIEIPSGSDNDLEDWEESEESGDEDKQNNHVDESSDSDSVVMVENEQSDSE